MVPWPYKVHLLVNDKDDFECEYDETVRGNARVMDEHSESFVRVCDGRTEDMKT